MTAHGAGATLVTEAVAEELVRRIEALRTDGDRRALSAWVEDLGAAYGEVGALRTLIDDLPGAMSGTALAAGAAEALAAELRPVTARAWRPHVAAAGEHLDEVDARIDALIVRLNARDPLSSEHSRAVAAWCARLGRRLGLDAREVAFVTRCGLLHDVGKALTPLEILNAPRALDDREWRVMRAHAATGEVLVRRVPELRPYAPAVRSHHERVDGAGYPDGLRGAAIPLVARVVAVADCFNAMIGRRPYRLPMEPSRALDELVRHRGSQFDPEIVDAMVGVVLG